jgi:hypothetical protein
MYSEWLTSEELFQKLEENNLEVTSVQLKKWRERKVLPEIKQVSLGRGKGTETRYPPETVERIRRICELQEDKRFKKNLEFLRWQLWREGYPISYEVIIETIETEVIGAIQELRIYKRDPLSSIIALAKEAAKNPKLILKFPGVSIKRIGLYGIGKVTSILLEAVLQKSDILTYTEIVEGEPSPAYIVERIMRLDRARTDTVGDVGPWLKGPPEEQFQGFSDIMSYPAMKRALRHASEADIEQARDDLLFFTDTLCFILGIVAKLCDRNAFGFRIAATYLRRSQNSLFQQAGLTLMVTSMRKSHFKHNLIAFRQGVEQGLDNYIQIDEYIKEHGIAALKELHNNPAYQQN